MIPCILIILKLFNQRDNLSGPQLPPPSGKCLFTVVDHLNEMRGDCKVTHVVVRGCWAGNSSYVALSPQQGRSARVCHFFQ